MCEDGGNMLRKGGWKPSTDPAFRRGRCESEAGDVASSGLLICLHWGITGSIFVFGPIRFRGRFGFGS